MGSTVQFTREKCILDGISYSYDHYGGIVVRMESVIGEVRTLLDIKPKNDVDWKKLKRSSKLGGQLRIRLGDYRETVMFPDNLTRSFPEKIAFEVRRIIEQWKIRNRILLVHSL